MVHFPQKIMGQFVICKNTKPGGGGSREVWQITRLFRIFFVKRSLRLTKLINNFNQPTLCKIIKKLFKEFFAGNYASENEYDSDIGGLSSK